MPVLEYIIIRVMVTESLTFPSNLSNEPRYFYAPKKKPYCFGYFNFSLNSEKRDLLRFRITAIF